MTLPLRTAVASIFILAAAATAPARSEEFKKENVNDSTFAKGAFSEAVTVTGPAKTIHLAGIGSEDPDDGAVRHKDDFLAQCRFALSKVAVALKANGATLSDIVKATSYVTDVRYRRALP